jgi:hypothetical protein
LGSLCGNELVCHGKWAYPRCTGLTLVEDVVANPELEEEQGRTLARAALKAGVECFLWSTLPSAKAFSNGELNVSIYECKPPCINFSLDAD